MNKEEIKKLYTKKIDQLKKNNYLYFEKNNPKISDGDFDLLKKEILELEKKYNFLNSKDSPSKILGFKPSKNFNKVSHKNNKYPKSRQRCRCNKNHNTKQQMNFETLSFYTSCYTSAHKKSNATYAFKNGLL